MHGIPTPAKDCHPACGCRATTPKAALAGAILAVGRASNPAQAQDSADAIAWALRDYGWEIKRQPS